MYSKYRLLLIGMTFLGSINGLNAQDLPVMIDGKIEKAEWQDASKIEIDHKSHFLIKEDSRFYYLAVAGDLLKPWYVDLFFMINDTLYNVHASSQLGDRVLQDTSWTDYEPTTNWGYNEGWIANIVQFDRQKMKKLKSEGFEGDLFEASVMPYDGLEFQFKKDQWPIIGAKIRLEIRNMIGSDGFKAIIFPSDTKRKEMTGWHTIDLK